MLTNEWVGKRKSARQPVNMRGEIRFMDGRPPITCRITDISSTGCAIDLAEAIGDIEDFDLFIEARSETKICKVSRNGGEKLGVAFLKSRLDDPLVMQTLMERVLRLERGFAELKGASQQTVIMDEERRASNEPRRAEDRELAYAGPSIDQRIQSLASGLADLRGTVDQLASMPQPPTSEDLVPRVDAQTHDIAAMKDEMAGLAKALRGVTLVGAPQSAPALAPDHSTEINTLKQELANLSVSMREIAAMPALRAPAMAAARAPELNVRDIAKIRADISEMRAAVQALQSAPAASAAQAQGGEDAATRAELADLRDRIDGVMENSPHERLLEFAEAIGSLRAEVGALREQGKPAAAPLAPVIPVERPGVDVALELEQLRGSVKTLIVLVSKTLSQNARTA